MELASYELGLSELDEDLLNQIWILHDLGSLFEIVNYHLHLIVICKL